MVSRERLLQRAMELEAEQSKGLALLEQTKERVKDLQKTLQSIAGARTVLRELLAEAEQPDEPAAQADA